MDPKLDLKHDLPRMRASRRERHPSLRVKPMTPDVALEELRGRVSAPGTGASLREVVRALYDAPLGRHGIRTVPSMTANIAAHREFFAADPEEVAS